MSSPHDHRRPQRGIWYHAICALNGLFIAPIGQHRAGQARNGVLTEKMSTTSIKK